MRFKQYLTELFQEKKDFKIIEKNDDELVCGFEIDDMQFEIQIAYFVMEERWEIFFERGGGGLGKMNTMKDLGEKGIEVYTYLISITKYFLREYEPEEYIYFEGYESKQSKLYKRLIKRFEKELKSMGYGIESRPGEEGITIERK